MKRNKRPTLADVARHARVSSATASRVLHNTGPVSQDLRERILKSVAALGYAPRQRISTLPVSSEGTLAVLAGDLLNPFFPQVVRGIQDEADNYGLILTLYNVTDHPQRQQQLVQRLRRQHIDGVIVLGTAPFSELLDWRNKQDIPLVVINRRYNQAGVHCILVDFENAMGRAVQHLLSLNHTRIGYLSAFSTSQIAVARQRGLESALTEAGIGMQPEWRATVPPGVEIDGGFQAMTTLLDLAPAERPTGVIAFNDVIALGALHAARSRRLRVPHDLSLIGVDDIFASAHADPPLTTISQPKYRMGALAVQTLRRIRHGQMSTPCSCTVLESPLIVRESTGPAPQSASS